MLKREVTDFPSTDKKNHAQKNHKRDSSNLPEYPQFESINRAKPAMTQPRANPNAKCANPQKAYRI
jgi:hypothetical protein